MNKSLRVKLSVTLMATVLVTMITSVLVNNFFLVDYYISGKQKSLVSAYSQINQLYNTFGVTYDSGNKPRRMRRQIFMNGLVRAALPV